MGKHKKPRSKAHRQKLSTAAIKKWGDPEERKRQSETHKKFWREHPEMRERQSERMQKLQSVVTFNWKGGLSQHTLYAIWYQMKARCSTSHHSSYKNYGGRGIRVCKRWTGKNGFWNFVKDVGERPSPEHTLERKDNNGNYTPKNVKWDTRLAQARNRRKRKQKNQGAPQSP